MNSSQKFGGIVLVALGTLFLLDNLGILHVRWALFFPALLIAGGIYVLFSSLYDDPKRKNNAASNLVPRMNASEADIHIEYAAGELLVDAIDAPDMALVRQNAFDVEQSITYRGDRVKVHLEPSLSGCLSLLSPWTWFDERYNQWQISLPDDLPIKLKVETGAAKCDLDLRHLLVKEFSLETGASSSRVEFPMQAGHTKARIEAGAASVHLVIPTAVAARIKVESAISTIEIDKSRFTQKGNFYESADYDKAAHTLDLKIEMGAGSLVVD